MKKETNHINKRPEVGSSTGICVLKLDGLEDQMISISSLSSSIFVHWDVGVCEINERIWL